MNEDAQKSIAGALLFGAAALSGNALLLTIAGGIGVNWSSEGLAGLWRRAGAPAPDAALLQVLRNAFAQAINELEAAYAADAGSRADRQAFVALRECLGELPQLAGGPASLPAARQELHDGLADLLYGHAALPFIQNRLLDHTARRFRINLAANAEAWRLYHGWLNEQAATSFGELRQSLQRLPAVLDVLEDRERSLAAFQEASERLEQLLAEFAEQMARAGSAASAVSFENIDSEFQGDLSQSAGNIVEGVDSPDSSMPAPGGASFRNERIKVGGNTRQAGGHIILRREPDGIPFPDADAPAESPITLTLRFTGPTDSIQVSWEADEIGTVTSRFVDPFAGQSQLPARALDVLQFPNYPQAAGQSQQAWFSFTPAEQQWLAEQQLWDAAERVTAGAPQQVGRRLLAALRADPAAAQALHILVNTAAGRRRELRLALHFSAAHTDLAMLPWELLWGDEDVPLLLSRDRPWSLARHLALERALPELPPRTGPLRVLAVVPRSGIPGGLRQAEQLARNAALQPLLAAGVLRLEELQPAGRAALVDAVQRFEPHVIHYFGHGRYAAGSGALLLDAAGGNGGEWTEASRLAPLFGSAQMLFLHACQGAMLSEQEPGGLLSGIAPALSAAGTPLVVGMQYTIRTTAATRISAVIYRELAAGRSVQTALARARQALFVGERDQHSWFVPALYIRSATDAASWL